MTHSLRIPDRPLWVLETVFLYAFLVVSAMSSSSLLYGQPIIGVLMWPCFVLGGGLVLYRVIHYRDYARMPAVWALVALLVSIGLTTLINFRIEFKENLRFCIHWVLFFIVVYTVRDDCTVADVRRRAEGIAAVFVGYAVVSAVASFVLMTAGVNEKITVSASFDYYIGFRIGRLFGTFINANNGAVTAAIATVLLLYFFCRSERRWVRALCVVGIAIEWMYVALSDSRSGAVCCGVVLATFVLTNLLYRWENRRWWLSIAAVALAAVTLVAGYLVPRELKKGYNDVQMMIAEHIASTHPDATPDKLLLVERGYDMTDDISNRRFDVWGGGLAVFTDSPRTMLTGCSFRGLIPYVQEHLPDSYLINNDANGDGTATIFNTLDNEVLNIVVAQGLLGAIPALIFVVIVLVMVFRGFFRVRKEYRLMLTALLAVVFGLAGAAMFGSVMFYHFSPNAVLFWVALGSMTFTLRHTEEVVDDE